MNWFTLHWYVMLYTASALLLLCLGLCSFASQLESKLQIPSSKSLISRQSGRHWLNSSYSTVCQILVVHRHIVSGFSRCIGSTSNKNVATVMSLRSDKMLRSLLWNCTMQSVPQKNMKPVGSHGPLLLARIHRLDCLLPS